MAGIKINQYPLERLTFGDDDYYDIDYWNGSAFETAKIKGSVIKAAIQAGISSANIMDTDSLVLAGDFTHDLNENNLVLDDGSFRITNGSLGVLGAFNATHDGATGQDISTFISSNGNPVLIANNTDEAVAIGTTGPAGGAILDISSSSKALLIPRLTTTQRDNITTPIESMLIYNSTTNQFEFRTSGGTWGALGGGGDSIYTADDSLTGNRTVDLLDNTLTFDANERPGLTTTFNGRTAFISNRPTTGEANILEVQDSLNNRIFEVRQNNSVHINAQGTGDVVIGEDAQIGTEDISLQGETFIQGTGTTTGTTLALYDADSPSPNKTWEWLDNGTMKGYNGAKIQDALLLPSVQEAANSATFTINADEQSDGVLTAMSASTTIAAPTGTPVQSQDLVFRFKDNGTARSLLWNAIFRVIGVTLPTTTVANKLTYVGCKYNSTDSKWDVIAVQQEA